MLFASFTIIFSVFSCHLHLPLVAPKIKVIALKAMFIHLSQAKLLYQTHQKNGFSRDCLYAVVASNTTNEKMGIHHYLVYLFLQKPFIWNLYRSKNPLKYYLLAIHIFPLIILSFLCF